MSTPEEQPAAYRLREDGVSWRETDGEIVVLADLIRHGLLVRC